jgi:uncharacterized membrane protein
MKTLIFTAWIVLVTCMMMPHVSAADLEYYGIDTTIEKNLQTAVTLTLIPVKPVNIIDLELDFTILNLSVTTMSGTSRCDFTSINGGSSISCNFYGMEEDDRNVRINFYTREAVRPTGNNYEFRLNFPVPYNTERVFSIVKLPAKAALSEEVVNQSYFPPDGSTLTDGRRMMVSWEDMNLTTEDTLSFLVTFEVMDSGGNMWDLTVIGMTSLVVIIMISVAVYMSRGSPKCEADVKVLPLLNKDEKKVVDIIARNDGQVRQSVIVKESDYSKAKVSRLIKNLKERGVVDTDPISGRENKVILKIKGVG